MPNIEEQTESDDLLFLKRRMLHLAVWEKKKLDARTGAALRLSGILKDGTVKTPPADTAELLQNPDHPKRIAAPAGPIVFVQQEEANRAIIDAPEHVLSSDRNIRVAAVSYLNRLALAGNAMGATTIELLRGAEQALASEDASTWHRAAIAVYDAFEQDFLLAIAGAKQSLALLFDEGLNEYLSKIIRPSAESIQALKIRVHNPIAQKDEMSAFVVKLSKSGRPFQERLDEYFDVLGHVPLAGPLSFGGVVSDFIRENGVSNVWNELWEWAQRKASPIAWYHACQACCLNASIVPVAMTENLWNEISQIVGWRPGESEGTLQTEGLKLRCDLAQYFIHYLEYLVPGQEGEASGAIAWWLSERIAVALGTSAEFMHALRQNTISREVELANFVWHLVHPSRQLGRLRIGCGLMRSIWSLSLQCQLAPLVSSNIPAEVHGIIQHAICGSLLGIFPWEERCGTEALYAFDESLAATVTAWSKYVATEDEKVVLNGLQDVRRKVRDVDDMAEQVSLTAGRSEAEEYLVGGAFRLWAYIHEGDFESVWERVLNGEWRERVMMRTRLDALNLIFEALNEMRGRRGGKWDAELPHVFATQAEQSRTDVDRRKAMFALCVMSSASAASTSAIRRLLRPEIRHEYREMAEQWREHLLSAQQGVPISVAARIRPIIAALRV